MGKHIGARARKARNLVDSITPKCKLVFFYRWKIYKEEIELQLGKLNKITVYTTTNKMKHFGLLSIENATAIGQNKSMKYDRYHI